MKLFFPGSIVVGCFFHFKTVGCDKMEKISILAPEIKAAMSPACNMFEYLLVVDPDDIDPKGIHFVMASLEKSLKL